MTTKLTIENEYLDGERRITSIEISDWDADLEIMCELFEDALKGHGYIFDGHVDIVPLEDVSFDAVDEETNGED